MQERLPLHVLHVVWD